MSGAKVTKNFRIKGSTTVEAAIVLPVFLVVIFTLAYIVKIFFAYNTVQASLTEVARRIANMSYFYHISGIKDYSDELNTAANEAQGTLDEQKKTITDAVGSFNDMFSTAQGTLNSGTASISDIQKIMDQAKSFDSNMEQVRSLVQSITSDPKAELKLFMKIFAQKLSYEITNRLVCFIAQGDLGCELNKRVPHNKDAALSLGIKNGIGGMDFSQSSVFGDTESLDFVVCYSLKPPVPFNLIPEIKLSNRIKIIAWTGGRGKSVKVEPEKKEEPKEDESIWVEMDQDKRYWDRGLEIEELYIGDLVDKCSGNGLEAVATPKNYPVIDAYTYNKQDGSAEYYDVFTLNPFTKTYSERPSQIGSLIKKHARRLLECDAPQYYQGVEVKKLKRIVIIIVPENSDPKVEEIYAKAAKEMDKLGVEVRFLKGYGAYTPPQEGLDTGEAENDSALAADNSGYAISTLGALHTHKKIILPYDYKKAS